MASRYDLDREQLAALCAGEPAFRVRQVWDGLHRRAVGPAAMTDLPLGLRERLEAALPPELVARAVQEADGGETVKWLWELDDGARVETVLMRYPDRATVCVSTQAGCAMGCTFCATGQVGFERHCTAGEIVEQVVHAVRAARPRRVSNVVFMGMGEPLANVDNTLLALQRLRDDLGISARSLTVSTVGIVPGILRLAASGLPVTLAVSLHGADDATRDRLVPVNRRYPLAELVDACRVWQGSRHRRLSFEWALIDGVNDRPADADRLADLARDLRAHVNVIPLNPTPGSGLHATPEPGVRSFVARLERHGVTVTVRNTRGRAIQAACGQLAADRPVRVGDPGRRSHRGAGPGAGATPPATRRGAGPKDTATPGTGPKDTTTREGAMARARSRRTAGGGRRGRAATGLALVALGVVGLVGCGERTSTLPALPPEAQRGREIASLRGCTACHVEGTSAAPGLGWAGAWGNPVELDDGTTITFDRAYMDRSIREPGAQRRKGAGSGMPTYELAAPELEALEAYLRALSTPSTTAGGPATTAAPSTTAATPTAGG